MNSNAKQLAAEAAFIINQTGDNVIFRTANYPKHKALEHLCTEVSIKYPHSEYGFAPEYMRLCSVDWWVKKLKRAKAQAIEVKQLNRLNFNIQELKKSVNRKTAKTAKDAKKDHGLHYAYVSDLTLSLHKSNKEELKAFIDAAQAVCEDGTILSLKRIAAASLSNPICRRAELMTRIRGFEEWAKLHGYVCRFITLTCPSKYHANSAKYDRTTPKQAQEYMVDTFAKYRAKIGRLNIQEHGFRVTEPHRDGTPHWHLLLWFENDAQADQAVNIITDYFLQEDGNERGAKKNRVKTVIIDESKGSAVGYIAKYIAKNIDGVYSDGKTKFDVKKGAGLDSVAMSERVLAYASLWGIRQFQQIGGVKVGAWRELRRIRDTKDILALPDHIKTMHAAADAGDWQAFMSACEGHELKLLAETSKDLLNALSIKYGGFDAIPDKDMLTALNQWQEPTVRRTKGLVVNGVSLVTRLKKWSVGIKSMSQHLSALAFFNPDSQIDNDFIEFYHTQNGDEGLIAAFVDYRYDHSQPQGVTPFLPKAKAVGTPCTDKERARVLATITKRGLGEIEAIASTRTCGNNCTGMKNDAI